MEFILPQDDNKQCAKNKLGACDGIKKFIYPKILAVKAQSPFGVLHNFLC